MKRSVYNIYVIHLYRMPTIIFMYFPLNKQVDIHVHTYIHIYIIYLNESYILYIVKAIEVHIYYTYRYIV